MKNINIQAESNIEGVNTPEYSVMEQFNRLDFVGFYFGAKEENNHITTVVYLSGENINDINVTAARARLAEESEGLPMPEGMMVGYDDEIDRHFVGYAGPASEQFHTMVETLISMERGYVPEDDEEDDEVVETTEELLAA